MKRKITLTLTLIFIFLKVQAQVPSINETKSNSFISDVYKKENQALLLIKNDEKKNLETEYKILSDSLKGLKKVEGITELDSIIIKKNIEISEKNKEIAEKNKEISALEKDATILNDNREKKIYIAYYDNILKIKKDSIDAEYKVLEQTIYKNDLVAIDSIHNLIAKKKQEIESVIQEAKEKIASLGALPRFLPTVKKLYRKKFFHDMYSNKTDKTILLNSFALNSNSDATAVQTEVVTDNMWVLRLSFGSVLSLSSNKDETTQSSEEQTKTETEQEAFSRLINGGGNFYLDAIFPIYTTNPGIGDLVTFYSYANVRGAMDIEGFSNNVDTSTGNGTFGINAYLGLSSDNKKFNFFVQGNVNGTAGTNSFYKNLGLNEEKAFLNGKIIAGLTILNNFRFSAIVTAFGSDEKIRSNKVIVGIQILPGL